MGQERPECPDCGHSPLTFRTFVTDAYLRCPECGWIEADHDWPVGLGDE